MWNKRKVPLVWSCFKEKEGGRGKAGMGELVRGKRSRGRQLKRWKDGLSERLEELGLREQDSKDRQRWRRGSWPPTPNKRNNDVLAN